MSEEGGTRVGMLSTEGKVTIAIAVGNDAVIVIDVAMLVAVGVVVNVSDVVVDPVADVDAVIV